MTTLDVSDEELHKNISYRALGSSIKMTRNHAYHTGGYEYVNWILSRTYNALH